MSSNQSIQRKIKIKILKTFFMGRLKFVGGLVGCCLILFGIYLVLAGYNLLTGRIGGYGAFAAVPGGIAIMAAGAIFCLVGLVFLVVVAKF